MRFLYTSIRMAVPLIVISSALYSCKTDTPALTPQVITKVQLIVTDNISLTQDTFGFIDWDANGPNAPARKDTIKLSAYTGYSIQAQLLNEAKTPTQDLSDTITAMGDQYLFAYTADPADSLVNFHTLDRDSKGMPIGIRSNWQTYSPQRGTLHLRLHHQSGNKNGTETPGNIDFEAYFPIVVR
jgi:hypothetical protein